MIRVKNEVGTATYYLEPYPHWDSEDVALLDTLELLRREVDQGLVKRGMKPNDRDRSKRLHEALRDALELVGFEVLEYREPPLNRVYDPSTTEPLDVL